ncbi:hypothetical protein E2C01_023984 [Portunus trituberculatus]|uniref:Uncharacterized protein n=1 Tax=Portunus trituberculatus TaxID=210409 RepID=A0A5B7ED67_PORTR|nr:hypothetical protein [Portunus trituberculatus]
MSAAAMLLELKDRTLLTLVFAANVFEPPGGLECYLRHPQILGDTIQHCQGPTCLLEDFYGH